MLYQGVCCVYQFHHTCIFSLATTDRPAFHISALGSIRERFTGIFLQTCTQLSRSFSLLNLIFAVSPSCHRQYSFLVICGLNRGTLYTFPNIKRYSICQANFHLYKTVSQLLDPIIGFEPTSSPNMTIITKELPQYLFNVSQRECTITLMRI